METVIGPALGLALVAVPVLLTAVRIPRAR